LVVERTDADGAASRRRRPESDRPSSNVEATSAGSVPAAGCARCTAVAHDAGESRCTTTEVVVDGRVHDEAGGKTDATIGLGCTRLAAHRTTQSRRNALFAVLPLLVQLHSDSGDCSTDDCHDYEGQPNRLPYVASLQNDARLDDSAHETGHPLKSIEKCTQHVHTMNVRVRRSRECSRTSQISTEPSDLRPTDRPGRLGHFTSTATSSAQLSNSLTAPFEEITPATSAA
jgi:hypothetical protein